MIAVMALAIEGTLVCRLNEMFLSPLALCLNMNHIYRVQPGMYMRHCSAYINQHEMSLFRERTTSKANIALDRMPRDRFCCYTLTPSNYMYCRSSNLMINIPFSLTIK